MYVLYNSNQRALRATTEFFKQYLAFDLLTFLKILAAVVLLYFCPNSCMTRVRVGHYIQLEIQYDFSLQ